MFWKSKYKENEERKQGTKRNEKQQPDRVNFVDGKIGFAGVEKIGALKLTKFDHVYIGDSGASCHIINLDEGTIDFKEIHEIIVFGNVQCIIT